MTLGIFFGFVLPSAYESLFLVFFGITRFFLDWMGNGFNLDFIWLEALGLWEMESGMEWRY